ncbi:hypothetical protein DFQ09_101541 [Winogradskyella pacifica]|jgi:hypothetical protein|uniref:Uncharacterized protein n=1 Tax=Winogradskyella pacifica TaxID=664642 RepID=A0A3D9N6K1_9FLAO|nr:hypothetical protein DFQ09_101541 [Winogradskyella pacifica]
MLIIKNYYTFDIVVSLYLEHRQKPFLNEEKTNPLISYFFNSIQLW